ncbi:hypothetical protein ACKWTF_009608 [Chironomus riparius]
MSRKTRTDYNNIFDNGLDNMSDLVYAFTKKNKRVHRIFDDDDDDEQINEKSYGLRLVSVHENEATTSKATSDKENGSQESNKKSITNVRPLSPVQIIEAPPEQILESRSPFKHPSQLSNRQNISLRRSLFSQPKNKNNDLICSTPSTRNQGTVNDFFGASSSRIESLSPIRKGLSNTVISIDDLKDIELIPSEDINNKNGQNRVIVQSLHNIEKDLREQFQIDQGTPKKTYSKSLAGDNSRRVSSERKNHESPSRHSFRSEPITRSQPTTQNFSVILEPMEISKDAVSMYRKTQLSRLSTSNRTNVNTFNMIETPIARQAKHPVINDSLLTKKLALCESDSEITDDESEHAEILRQSAKQSQKQKTVETNEHLTNDESDKTVESPKRRKISQNISSTPKKAPLRRPSHKSASTRQDPVEVQNNITNDDSDEENQQFELVEVNNSKIIQEIVTTPKNRPSRRPSSIAVSQKSIRIDEEARKFKLSGQKSKKTEQEVHKDSSKSSDDDRHTRNSQQVNASPKKLPPKAKKIVHEPQNNSASESEDERTAKKDKNHKKNVIEPKKKGPERKNTTEESEDMVMSESEPETNKKEHASTKTSKQMSISDNIRRGRKSSKSTEQMILSEFKDESTQLKSRKSNRNTEQMSMSEEESELKIDPKENRKSKRNKKHKQSLEVDLTVHDENSDKELIDNEQESQESEDETPLKIQNAAKKGDKKSQKGNKKKVSESEGSETQYSDVSLSNYTALVKPKPKTPIKSKKSAANVKPDPPKNKKSVSENSGSDEEPFNQAEEPQFKKPGFFKKSIRDTILCNLSNTSAGSLVPTEIIESFRTLQKPGNNTTSIVPESSKLAVSKRTKQRNVNPNKDKIAKYLQLEKNVKHKKTKNDAAKSRKRTLYNQASDHEDTVSSTSTEKVPDIDPIDRELTKELSAVRRSIDTMSNASSQPFNATIPTQDHYSESEEDEAPIKKGKHSENQKGVDESDQEMEDVQQATKSRERSKRNKKPVNDTNTVNNNQDVEEEGIKTRGRSKKNKFQKVQAKKQQTTATEEAPEDDSQQQASKVVKKPRMARELKHLIIKPASKRQNNAKDDTEPPIKTRRRAASNTSEDNTSETSKNTDEGFQSNDEYDDVWYDPMDRGCQRTGLRVRKFTKSKDGRFAIQYGVFTKNDSKAIQLQKQYNIKESEVHEPTLAPYIQPGNRLELVKSLIMEKKLQKKGPPKKKEVKANVEKVNDGASTSHQAMDVDSMASFATARTNETQSGVVTRLLDSFNRIKDDNTNPISVMETATYAISQINRLIWHPIGAGVFYSSFKENSFDGFLKIVKGGYKKGAKTKLAVVKMTLLCGVVDIKINDTKLRIENLGFITITRGQSYRIMNASDETAIILMTRLDDEETTSPNQNSS